MRVEDGVAFDRALPIIRRDVAGVSLGNESKKNDQPEKGCRATEQYLRYYFGGTEEFQSSAACRTEPFRSRANRRAFSFQPPEPRQPSRCQGSRAAVRPCAARIEGRALHSPRARGRRHGSPCEDFFRRRLSGSSHAAHPASFQITASSSNLATSWRAPPRNSCPRAVPLRD